MKLAHMQAQADKHGDFYLYYLKHTGKGTTYLVGTTDFDNKYIQERHADGKSGLPSSVPLEKLRSTSASRGEMLVFSWTNDKFRSISAKEARRMSPLGAELRNGRNR